MQSSVGLLICTITRRLDKCVTVMLGHLNVTDTAQAEVWANLSETALLSFKQDLHQPVREGASYELRRATCCVLDEEADCICARVMVVHECDGEERTGRAAEVWACLSEAGIDQLLERLRAADGPINLAPVNAARKETPYAWTVRHRNNDIQCQFPFGQPEQTFAVARLAEIELLLVEPKDLNAGLPSYRLTEAGFERLAWCQPPELLPLPVPDEPFHWRYHRRITVTVLGQHGVGQPQDTRIVQCLGWRVERPGGDLICELGVEEDGSWLIHRRGRAAPEGEAAGFAALTEEEFTAALAAGGSG